MLNRFDTRAFDEALDLKVFSEVISPTEYHTFYCESNIASVRDTQLYRVTRIVTKIQDPANRDLDRTQKDHPIVNYPAGVIPSQKNGGDLASERYEFSIANAPTTSSNIGQKDGYVVTRKPITI